MKADERIAVPGWLVSFPARGARLDGFLTRGGRPGRPLLVFVHGMRSNFHGSVLKKEFARGALRRGFDALLFNNRGAGDGTLDERFADCLADLDAALAFARGRGHRSFVLVGHSTGCQKITHYQARRRDPAVRGLALLAPADDLAIARRDLGRSYGRWVAEARRRVAAGRGRTLLPPVCQGFSARRLLSVADPRRTEAALFDYSGPMRSFASLTLPLLVVFGRREEYACRPLEEMERALRARTRSPHFEWLSVDRADHGYHGHEAKVVRAVVDWAVRLGGRRGGA